VQFADWSSSFRKLPQRIQGTNNLFFLFCAEVALDKNRAWCPQAGCETICHICASANLGVPGTAIVIVTNLMITFSAI
jgi:hypothetical protein